MSDHDMKGTSATPPSTPHLYKLLQYKQGELMDRAIVNLRFSPYKVEQLQLADTSKIASKTIEGSEGLFYLILLAYKLP